MHIHTYVNYVTYKYTGIQETSAYLCRRVVPLNATTSRYTSIHKHTYLSMCMLCMQLSKELHHRRRACAITASSLPHGQLINMVSFFNFFLSLNIVVVQIFSSLFYFIIFYYIFCFALSALLIAYCNLTLTTAGRNAWNATEHNSACGNHMFFV